MINDYCGNLEVRIKNWKDKEKGFFLVPCLRLAGTGAGSLPTGSLSTTYRDSYWRRRRKWLITFSSDLFLIKTRLFDVIAFMSYQ